MLWKGGPEAAEIAAEAGGFEGGGTRLEFGRLVTIAVRRIGSAILNASLTTATCVSFLVFCEFVVLRRVGVLILMSTSVSIFFTFFLMIPLLALAGPVHFVRTKRAQVTAVTACVALLLGFVIIVYLLDLPVAQYLGQ